MCDMLIPKLIRDIWGEDVCMMCMIPHGRSNAGAVLSPDALRMHSDVDVPVMSLSSS